MIGVCSSGHCNGQEKKAFFGFFLALENNILYFEILVFLNLLMRMSDFQFLSWVYCVICHWATERGIYYMMNCNGFDSTLRPALHEDFIALRLDY